MKKSYLGQVWWLTPIIPALWEGEAGVSLESGVSDQPGQHEVVNQARWFTSVISAVWEAKAGGSVEVTRTRRQTQPNTEGSPCHPPTSSTPATPHLPSPPLLTAPIPGGNLGVHGVEKRKQRPLICQLLELTGHAANEIAVPKSSRVTRLRRGAFKKTTRLGRKIGAFRVQEVRRVTTARQRDQNSPTATEPITASPHGPLGWAASSVFLLVAN
ncbi:hypothetical protein AAY473_014817 [Plecturocebus cupreus]